MTVIGSASINIRADDKYFEPDVRRAVAKIKDLRVALKVDADMSAANKKLRDLRYRMSQNEVQIKIRANDVGFEADVRAAVRKIKNVTIDLKADVDSSKASKKIRDLRYRITSKPAILKVDADVSKAEEKMRKLLEKFTESTVNITAKAHTGAAHTALTDLQTRYGKNVNFTATADTKMARAALATAARNRRAKITPFIDPTSMAALKGAFNILTGTLPFDKVRTSLSGIVANFEGLAVKAALVGTALLSVGAVALTAGANVFSIAGDITQVAGAAALLPAAFIAMGTAIAANKMAWKGFGEALSSDPKKAAAAMALLPPQAQEAADAVRGLGTEIQKATQVKFWEALGTSLQDMVTNLLPQLKEGFEYVGESLGAFEAATFDGVSAAFGDGVLLGILTNVGDMFKSMTGGVDDFIQGIATLGRVGATYLPQFGAYLSDAAIKFGEFIRQADEAGRINDWIDTSIRRFQELGSIVKSTAGIMGGLTEVARLSGAPGLTEMADGFRNIANVVNSEPFQSQLLVILEGARVGTEALGAGLSTLTQLFWDSATSISAFLTVAGQIGGLVFENITALFDGTGLGSGLMEGLLGLKDAMGILKPGFADLGIAIGDLGIIAGEIFRSLAPGLNILAETISKVIAGMKDGILDALPVLNQFMQAVLTLASGPIVALAEAFGDMLTTFSGLPGVVQTVIMSLGLFLLLKPKFAKFFGGMADSLRKEDSNIGKTYRNMRTNATDTSAMMRQDMRNVGTSFRSVMTETGNAATKASGKVTSTFGSMATSLRTTMAPLGKDLGNALMAAGGMETVKKGFNDLRYNAATNFAATTMAASMNAQTMKGYFTDATDKIGTKFADMSSSARRGLGAVSGYAQTAAGAASTHINNMAKSIDGNLGKISPMATKAFNTMSLGAAAAGSMAGQHIGKMTNSIDGHLGKISPSAQQAFRGFGSFALSAKDVAGGHIGKMASSIDGHLGRISPSAQREFNRMSLAAQAGAQLTKTAIASIPDHARTAASGVSSAFSATGTAFKDVGTGAANMAKGMHAGLAPARTAFSALATHAVTAGRTAAAGMGSALKTAGAGLAGALGGPWGIALAAGAVALGGFAAAEQKTAAYVDGLAGSLDKQTGAFTNATRTMVTETLTAEKKIAGIFNMGSEFDTLKQAGVNLDTFMLAVDGSESAMKEMNVQMEASGEGASTLGTAAKMASDVGLGGMFGGLGKVAVAHGLFQTEGDKSNAILEKHQAALEAARIKDEQVAEAMGVASAAAGLLSANYAILEDSTSSVSDKTSALSSNLDLMNAGQTSSIGASSKYHETLRSTNTALDTMIANNNGVTTGLLGVGGAFDVTTAKGNDLFKAMDAQKESILEMGMATMQAAINAGDSLPQAQAKALLSMQESTTAMKGHLESVGFSAEDAQAIMDQLGLDDEKLKGALVVDTKQAEMDVARAGIMANAVAKGNYEMVLAALPDDAKAALTDTMNLGDKFKNGEYKAILDVLDKTPGGMEAAVLGLSTYAGSEWLAHLKALNLVPEEVAKANAAAQALMPEANLDLVANDMATAVLENVEAFNVSDKPVNMTGNDLVSDILNKVNSSPLMDKESQLDVRDLVTQAITDLNNKQLNGKISNIEANDLASFVMEDINALTMDGKVSTLTADDLASTVLMNLQEMEFNDKEAVVTMRDGTKPGVDSAVSTVETGLAGVGGGGGGMSVGLRIPISVDDMAAAGTASAANTMETGVTDQHRGIFASNNTAIPTSEAQGTMGGLMDVVRGLFGINHTGAATGEAQGTMGSLTDVVRGLFGINNTGAATGEAQGTMGSLQNVYRDLQAFNMTAGATNESQATMNTLHNVMRDLQAQNTTGGPLQASQATMDSLQSVSRDLQAQNLTGGPKGAAQGTMNSLQSVIRDLNANNQVGGPVNAANGEIRSVRGANVDVVANDRGSAQASAVRGAIDLVKGKTVDIITRFFRRDENANGGVYDGGGNIVMANGGIIKGVAAAQTFANGGFSGVNSQAVKAFAGGGIENHTAQIAKGAWPVRIWAEPETGGEAYIPLSPNKRKRSLDILRMVMAEFGVQGYMNGKAFADGGINKAEQYTTPKVISSRYAAASTGSVTPTTQATTQMAAPVINVHPSQGLNEEQIGVIASDRLWFNIQNSSF